MELSYDVEYISGGINVNLNNLDWGRNNLVCYGSKDCVHIYDPEKTQVVECLSTRRGAVCSAVWIKGRDVPYEDELVTMVSSFAVYLWNWNTRKRKEEFDISDSTFGNSIAALYKNTERRNTFIFIGCVDSSSFVSSVRIYKRKFFTESFDPYQEINMEDSKKRNAITRCLNATVVERYNQVVLGVAASDNSINLYIEDESQNKFILAKKIVHDAWMNSVDFSVEPDKLSVVVSCQNNLSRLWEMELTDCIPKLDVLYVNTKMVPKEIMFAHDSMITSARFNPADPNQILTASVDQTIVIWKYVPESNFWLDSARMGNFGGNACGFYGGIFSPDGQNILGYGYGGGLHMWHFDATSNNWSAVVVPSGHNGNVTDITWEPKGDFLLSTSEDKTTRVHAPFLNDNLNVVGWFEMARPQIHGYSLSAIAPKSRYEFISGSEEKVIRMFRAPINFVRNIHHLCKLDDEDDRQQLGQDSSEADARPLGAVLPALGLSNKAVFINEREAASAEAAAPRDAQDLPQFEPQNFVSPPTEDHLSQNTLWPEVQKLYGHGSEVYCLAVSPDGKFLASASIGKTEAQAAILIWDLSSLIVCQIIESHNLTVTELAFSPNSQYLLSVSRDRRWSLFEFVANKFERIAISSKINAIHRRVIWTGCWSNDNKYFATGSRDAKFVIWELKKDNSDSSERYSHVQTVKLEERKDNSVQAAAFAPITFRDQYMFAIGTGYGSILIYVGNETFEEVLEIKNTTSGAVKKLKFRPVMGRACVPHTENILQLACCGDNHVKIYNINIQRLYMDA